MFGVLLFIVLWMDFRAYGLVCFVCCLMLLYISLLSFRLRVLLVLLLMLQVCIVLCLLRLPVLRVHSWLNGSSFFYVGLVAVVLRMYLGTVVRLALYSVCRLAVRIRVLRWMLLLIVMMMFFVFSAICIDNTFFFNRVSLAGGCDVCIGCS